MVSNWKCNDFEKNGRPEGQQDTKEYLIRGVSTSEFSRSQLRGDQRGGEEGRSGGRVNRAGRGKRGENEGKRLGGKGPKKHTQKTLIWVQQWVIIMAIFLISEN